MKAVALPHSRPTREPVLVAVFEKLGGRAALGADVASAADLAKVVSGRIPLKSLQFVQKQGFFSDAEIQHFIIPARTRRHRQEKKERLTVEESDRLVRLTRIQAPAEDVFGESQQWSAICEVGVQTLSATAS